jgi:hypothetical protein
VPEKFVLRGRDPAFWSRTIVLLLGRPVKLLLRDIVAVAQLWSCFVGPADLFFRNKVVLQSVRQSQNNAPRNSKNLELLSLSVLSS